MFKQLLVGVVLVVMSQGVLAETINYFCDYRSWSNEEGNHKVSNKFELNFIIDLATTKSYMLGNNGSTEVNAIPERSGGFSFIEITGSGNVMTTAVDQNLISVHSRNTLTTSGLLPSQYYGKCVIR